MRILFIAPEICPPWSEGRKKLVRELIEELGKEHQMHLITSSATDQPNDIGCEATDSIQPTALGRLTSVCKMLPSVIKHFRPDITFHFPYGTFKHLRGIANIWVCNTIHATCQKQLTPCITVFYALDNSLLASLATRVLKDIALNPAPNWRGLTVNIGLKPSEASSPQLTRPPRTILFLAGMWQPTIERFNHVLKVRGLEVLLKAGRYLADQNVRLIIGCPLFEKQEFQERLRNHPNCHWPQNRLQLESLVKIPDIFYRAALFIFPIQEAMLQFIPTSILESMAADTPVVMSNWPYLRDLAQTGKTGFLFDASSPEQLAQTILNALDNRLMRDNITLAAKQLARTQYSIKNTASQLVAIAENHIKHYENPA